MRERLRCAVVASYLWVMMTLFGAIVMETFMVYPNIFANPPDSLALTMEFFAVTGPNDFFPPLGLASWVVGAAALVVCWRERRARWWMLLSLAMICAEGIVSILYFWPRNEIMFVEGSSMHPPEYLRQVAQEFETWHWRSRMGFNTVSAVAAFGAFLTVHRTGPAAAGRASPAPRSGGEALPPERARA